MSRATINHIVFRIQIFYEIDFTGINISILLSDNIKDIPNFIKIKK